MGIVSLVISALSAFVVFFFSFKMPAVAAVKIGVLLAAVAFIFSINGLFKRKKAERKNVIMYIVSFVISVLVLIFYILLIVCSVRWGKIEHMPENLKKQYEKEIVKEYQNKLSTQISINEFIGKLNNVTFEEDLIDLIELKDFEYSASYDMDSRKMIERDMVDRLLSRWPNIENYSSPGAKKSFAKDYVKNVLSKTKCSSYYLNSDPRAGNEEIRKTVKKYKDKTPALMKWVIENIFEEDDELHCNFEVLPLC